MKMPARFSPDSRWVRYDAATKLWIPNRKRIYLYWYKFLQLALSESPQRVDLEVYKDWGNLEYIASATFDEWWRSHWVDLFGYKDGESPKFSLSTSRPKTDAIRYAYLVYTNRHRGDNWDIACWIQKREVSRRGIPVPSFAYATEGIQFSVEDKLIVQSRVGRYKRQAKAILSNVCSGVFP
jgi:hypothetical protein